MTQQPSEGPSTSHSALRKPNPSRDLSPALPPAANPNVDPDTGERAAREQLEKASLASMGGRGTHDAAAEMPKESEPVSSIYTKAVPEMEDGYTVRSLPKHSLEATKSTDTQTSLGSVLADSNNDTAGMTLKDGVHTRPSTLSKQPLTMEKEPREVMDRSTDAAGVKRSTKNTVGEAALSGFSSPSLHSPPIGPQGEIMESSAASPPHRSHRSRDLDLSHEGMSEKAAGDASPRRKRSRDHLDTDADREQKIIATEEARAQRLSSEVDRTEIDAVPQAHSGLRAQNSDGQKHNASQSTSVFGTTSKFMKAAPKSDISTAAATVEPRMSSPSAYASSGFAALANSSASPFGTFASMSYSSSSFIDSTPATLPQNPGSAPSIFTRTASDSSSENEHKASSLSFATTSSVKPSMFGGSAFGRGFDSGFGAGAKLTSFAAPNGDAQLDGRNRPIKPIGSPSQADQDKDTSGSEADDKEEAAGEDLKSHADARFRNQDVETGEAGEESLFALRASLYSFKNNAWKESGKGIFKFNVTDPTAQEGSSKTGRFIMRAHQTFRVLLNAPVFKEMKVGDSKGNEPTGKSFAFAVIEDGKPTPYMIKLGDSAESKDLYYAVLQLQEELK